MEYGLHTTAKSNAMRWRATTLQQGRLRPCSAQRERKSSASVISDRSADVARHRYLASFGNTARIKDHTRFHAESAIKGDLDDTHTVISTENAIFLGIARYLPLCGFAATDMDARCALNISGRRTGLVVYHQRRLLFRNDRARFFPCVPALFLHHHRAEPVQSLWSHTPGPSRVEGTLPSSKVL